MSNRKRIVNTKALVTRVLYFWRLIVIMTLLFGILGAGKNIMSQKASIAQAKETQELTKNDNDKKTVDLSYNQELESIDQKLADSQDYLRNAPIMRINPFQSYRVSNSYYVEKVTNEKESESIIIDNSTGTGSNNDTVSGLLSIFLNRYVDWKQVGEKIGEDYYYYLNESVMVRATGDVYEVYVIYENEEDANIIMDHVHSAIEKGFNEYSSSVGISVTDLGRHSMSRINPESIDIPISKYNYLNSLMNVRNNLVNNADIVNKNGVRTNIGNIKTSISKKEVLQSAIKFGVVGGALSVIIALTLTLLGNKVLSSDELYDNYEMKKLFENPIVSNKKGIIDTFIFNIMNGKDSINSEEQWKLCALELENRTKESSIILVGDDSREELENLSKKLSEVCPSIVFKPLYDPVNNAQDRQLIAETKEVIVYAKQGTSSYSRLNKILDVIINNDIQVIGSICK